MKVCCEMRHLEQFGIKLLTGEADALGYRILCDLDEQGVKVFKECFGIPSVVFKESEISTAGRTIHHGLADNWNSGSIASVMLTGHEIIPLGIMGFYLQGHTVVVTDKAAYGLEEYEDVVLNEDGDGYNLIDHRGEGCMVTWNENSVYGAIRRIIRQKKSDGRVVQGTRNVHQFTGRVS